MQYAGLCPALAARLPELGCPATENSRLSVLASLADHARAEQGRQERRLALATTAVGMAVLRESAAQKIDGDGEKSEKLNEARVALAAARCTLHRAVMEKHQLQTALGHLDPIKVANFLARGSRA